MSRQRSNGVAHAGLLSAIPVMLVAGLLFGRAGIDVPRRLDIRYPIDFALTTVQASEKCEPLYDGVIVPLDPGGPCIGKERQGGLQDDGGPTPPSLPLGVSFGDTLFAGPGVPHGASTGAFADDLGGILSDYPSRNTALGEATVIAQTPNQAALNVLQTPGPIEASGPAGPGGVPLYDAVPDTWLQGFDLLDQFAHGSVNVANRGLYWGEVDATYPGASGDSPFVIGRRYFSRLSFDGVGSVGVGWVSNLYERILVTPTGALRHMDWNQPFDDPDFYFDPVDPGEPFYVAPAVVGASITENAGSTTERYTLSFKDGREHGFDDQGRIRERRDEYGNTTSFAYDAAGNLDQVTDTRGQVFDVATDAQGYITGFTDPAGATTTYELTPPFEDGLQTGYLTRVVYPARDVYTGPAPGTVTTRTTSRTFHYNVNGRIERIDNDAGEAILQVTYDPADPAKVDTQTDANGAVYEFEEPSPEVVSVLTPNGFKREYVRNLRDEVIEIRRYVMNFRGGFGRTTDPDLRHEWQLVRDNACSCGVITKIIEPDGGSFEVTYDAEFNITQLTKHANPAQGSDTMVWKWTYDSDNRIQTHIPPEGNASGNPGAKTFTVTRMTDGDVNNPGGTIREISVPAQGGRAWPSVWKERRDAEGRIIEIRGPTNSASDATPSFLGEFTYHDPGVGSNSGLLQKRNAIPGALGLTYQWNARGQIVSITTDTGEQFQASYDGEGNIASWTAPALGTQQYQHEWTYDAEGRVGHLRYKYYPNPPGSPNESAFEWIDWFYDYDASGNLRTLTKELDDTGATSVAVFQYDLHHNLNWTSDPDGRISGVIYDERDLPWQVFDGIGTPQVTMREVDYTSEGQIAQIKEPLYGLGEIIVARDYDRFDRLHKVRTVRGNGSGEESGYVEVLYEPGSRISDIKAFGIVGAGPVLVKHDQFIYGDWHEHPTQQTSRVYDDNGAVLLRTVDTFVFYTASGLPWAVSTGSGADAIAAYLFFYDQHWGVPAKVADLDGNSISWLYGPKGYPSSEITKQANPETGVPLFLHRDFETDLFGRVTKVTHVAPGQNNRVEEFGYDSTDGLVEYKDAQGNVHKRSYRYDGAPVLVESLIGGTETRATSYQYTPAGLLSKLIDERNNSVDFFYDGRGRLAQEAYPDGSLWSYVYNAANEIVKVTYPTGRSLEFLYDWKGNLSKRTFKDALGAEQRAEDFVLNALGDVKRITRTDFGQPSSWVEFARDSEGNILSETTGEQAQVLHSVDYTRDGLGRATTITGPSGIGHRYTYDTYNRVSEVKRMMDSTETPLAQYDYVGPMAAVYQRWSGDGSTMTATRSGFGQITDLVTQRADASYVNQFHYEWDDKGLLKYENRLHEAKGDVFWYDGINRLNATTKDTIDPATEWAAPFTTPQDSHVQFALDDDHHRESVTVKIDIGGGTGTATEFYTTDPDRHHYTATTGTTRQFDVDGRLTQIASIVNTTDFVYDVSDDLVEVLSNGLTKASYEYDALGRRTKKIVGSVVTRYVYAGPWILEEYRQDGAQPEALEAVHFHGAGIDEVVMSMRVDVADVDGDGDTAEFVDLYMHQNRQGSVTEVTRDDGTVIESYSYEAFGKRTVKDSSGQTVATSPIRNSFTFTGREFDEETGFYFYRARTYDPATGSFLQEDPLGMEDDLNPVIYALSNPVMYVDPMGTLSIGQAIGDLMDFIEQNAALVAGLAMELLMPLQGILDVISSLTGKDITSWIAGGLQGVPKSMGWWSRAVTAARAAIKIAAGAFGIISKIGEIMKKLKALMERARAAARGAGRSGRSSGRSISTTAQGVGGKGGPCFVPGTLVLAAGGAFVPIEDISPGDLVRSEIPAATSQLPEEHGDFPVSELLSHSYTGAIHVVTITDDAGRSCVVEGTPEHPFWSVDRHGWTPLRDLRIGSHVDTTLGQATIVDHEIRFGTFRVHNLTVPESNTYRVGPLGILVHNTYPDRPGMSGPSVPDGKAVKVELDPRGLVRTGRPLSPRRARKHVEGGGSVYTKDRGTAEAIAGPRHVGPEIHLRPDEVRFEHLHPHGRRGGHVFFGQGRRGGG